MINDTINFDLIIALDPRLRMRRDVDRIYIFPLNPFTYHEEYKSFFIPSAEAILITLFDGNLNIYGVIRNLAFLLDISIIEAEKIIRNFLLKYKKYFIEVTQENKNQIYQYNSVDFVIPLRKTDLSFMYPKIPEVIMFIPTLLCDFNCKYCYAPKNSSYRLLPLSIISDFIYQLSVWQLPALFFSGGDFFSYPHYKELIEICNKNKLKPIIPTKKILLDSDIEFLQSFNLKEIQISVDAIDDDLVQFLIQSSSDYVKNLIKSIKKLIASGINVNTNTVITSYNIKKIPGMILQLYELGIKHITLSPYARSLYHHNDLMFCDLNSYHWLNDQVDRLKASLNNIVISYKYIKDHTYMTREEKEKFYANRPECMAGKNGLIILPDGKITICETLYFEKNFILGDLKEQSLSDIWFSEKRQNLVFGSKNLLTCELCMDCPQKIDCYQKKGKCFVRALQAFGNIKMPDPFCPFSSGGNRIL